MNTFKGNQHKDDSENADILHTSDINSSKLDSNNRHLPGQVEVDINQQLDGSLVNTTMRSL